jgi:vacuolar-type H+-ATPase subunit I/STV1
MDDHRHHTSSNLEHSLVSDARKELEEQERRIQDEIQHLKIEKRNIKKRVKALKKIESQQRQESDDACVANNNDGAGSSKVNPKFTNEEGKRECESQGIRL